MTFDFRASQLRTSKIIASGSTGTNAKLLLYPIAAQGSPLNQGNIDQALFNTGSIGSDVFLFISGGIGGTGGENHDITAFGGDVYASGNLFVSGVLETSLGVFNPVALPVSSAGELLAGATANTIFVVDGTGVGTLLGVNALPVASYQISDGGTTGISLLTSTNILSAQNTLNLPTDFISQSVLTTQGDIIVRGTGSADRLAIGTSGTVLVSNGTTALWDSAPAPAGVALLAGGNTFSDTQAFTGTAKIATTSNLEFRGPVNYFAIRPYAGGYSAGRNVIVPDRDCNEMAVWNASGISLTFPGKVLATDCIVETNGTTAEVFSGSGVFATPTRGQKAYLTDAVGGRKSCWYNGSYWTFANGVPINDPTFDYCNVIPSSGSVVNTGLVTGTTTATSFIAAISNGAATSDKSELTLSWPVNLCSTLTFRITHVKAGSGNQVCRMTLTLGGGATDVWPMVCDENGNVTMESGWPGTPRGQAASPTRSVTWIKVIVGPSRVSFFNSPTSVFGGPMYDEAASVIRNNTTTVTMASLKFAGQQVTAPADADSTITVDNIVIRQLS